MREILFRGKRVDNGKWVEGIGLFRDLQFEHYQLQVKYGEKYYWNSVTPDTVGQYTGLTDKNGEKIFEGDIVKVENALVRGNFAVEYGMSASFIVSDGERRYFFGGYNSEVIGNIHDNPELLEGRQ